MTSIADDGATISRAERTARELAAFWSRIIPERLHDIILPHDAFDQLNPNEQVELIIYKAWYRNPSTFILYNFYPIVLFVTLFASAAIGLTGFEFGLNSRLFDILVPWIILGVWALLAIYENIAYLKWRMVITTSRIIFSRPQQDGSYLSDSIQFNGKPQVLDSNWSNDQLLRTLQIIYGTRDLAISPQGLQFVAGSARVKDAVVMPDVEVKKIEQLKRIVFS